MTVACAMLKLELNFLCLDAACRSVVDMMPGFLLRYQGLGCCNSDVFCGEFML